MPFKEKRVKYEHQPDWFSTEIKSIIQERDHCKKKGNHDMYKILRNKSSYLIKKSKRDFFNSVRRIKIQHIYGKISKIYLI